MCSSSGDGGPVSAASVCDPRGLAVDSAGNLYVTDRDRVRKITTDGIIQTIAGGDSCTVNGADGQPAASVCLYPFSLAVDSNGSLYISGSPIRKVTPDGLITTIGGGTISGFAGDGGPATLAQVSNSLNGIAVDRAGNLYIADTRNGRVRKVTADGVISTIAGNGVNGSAGDGGPATSAQMKAPVDVFIDRFDNIYILDGALVRKITTDGVIRTIAGCTGVCVGAPGQDGHLATESVLRTPQRIAVDSAGALYIAEADRVRKVGADGIMTTVATFDPSYQVLGFALSPAGGFYIGTGDSAGRYRIQKVTPDGAINTVAGSGICPFALNIGDGGPATSAQLCYPAGIKLDAAGNLYVAQNNRIRKISPAGIISTVAGGNIVPGFSGDGGPATSAQLNNGALFPDVAVDGAGNLYIADSLNGRIRKVSPSTATQSFNLAASSADYRAATSLSGPIAVGYGTVQPAPGKSTPSGIAVFSYRSNGALVSETAVPASPLRQSGRIYAESSGAVRTAIAIANPSDQDAAVSFYFTDKDGVNSRSVTTALPAHEQYAAFLDEAPYHGSKTAQSFTFTSSVPVGAIALRSYVNERGDPLMTTLPVSPLSSNASGSTGKISLPHFAAGGGWTTQVLLVNPTDQPLSGTVNMDATYTYAITPRSSAKITSANSDVLRTGNIVITPAQGSGSPIVSSVFTLTTNGITVTETGIATTGVAQSFWIFAESDSGRQLQTGIAIANTTAGSAIIQFELLTLDGQPSRLAGPTTLGPNEHIAMFLNQIPGVQNLPASFRGVLHISSNTSISAIGLRTRYNERGDFLISTTPAIADNSPSSTEESVFPQVVSGSGYTTEFILMNAGGASQGTLSLTSQTGTELPLFAP